MRKLSERVAVVTGAGSGIGRALCVELANKGCDVALVDVDRAGMDATAEMVRAIGRRASTHHADVAVRERMRALPDEVIAEHGRVHILVNNAGVTTAGTFEEVSVEDFEWVVGINLLGVAYGIKFFLPHLKRQDEGHIVNLSSLLGFAGVPGQASYCATKFAVRGLSEVLHTELADSKIGVTSVHPGAIKTNIVSAMRTSDDQLRERLVKLFDRYAMPPSRVAQKIVRAIERNKMRVIITGEAHLFEWSKRIGPELTNGLIARLYKVVEASAR